MMPTFLLGLAAGAALQAALMAAAWATVHWFEQMDGDDDE